MSEPDLQRPLERLFVEQARRTPDQIALIEGARSITYAQLESRSARAAAALRSRGIAEGSVVGLHIDRSVDWVASVLAILRTRAAVMPLPPNYPSARLSVILAEAGAQAVIHNRTTPLDPALGQHSLDFDELCSETTAAPETGRERDYGDPGRAAFVLCSSGSTGLPKMIVRSHRSFFHRLSWTWTQQPFGAGEIGCHKAHTTTTHGLYELFEPLLRGVPAVIVPDAQVRDLERFWSVVRSHAVTRLLIVPSAMKASLDMPGFTPPALRVVVLMGEHLQSGLAQRIVDAFPATTRLYSIYGSTEASSTLVCDLRESTQPGRELPLGVPITQDVGLHVLDRNLDPVEPGQSGRLYISGPALFTGYFRNPDLTSSVVVIDPRNAERLYDTRDDVRRTPDGKLIFVGRADDTVKIRGFRVELTEVERAIAAHPEVTQAAVVATGSDTAEAALIGFFTPRNVMLEEIYQALRDRLPPYMIPSSLVGLDAFPLTERSKLDRKRLLAEHLPALPDELDVRTMSDFERRVAAQWERTLGHRRFDRDSSFFEVGGTSLTTSVLVHGLRTEFDLDREQLPGQFAYRFPTVASMARKLQGAEGAGRDGAGGSSVLVTLRRATDASKAPLFFVASAGGTVGAYQKVAAALRHEGEIIGVRDPYVDGDRDPTEGFKRWVGRYLDAIGNHQPRGPYYLAAYSSAGAFGYEMARQLRQRGAEVGLLALIDPLDMGGGNWRRFGWWACRAARSHALLRRLVRLAARLRQPSARLLRALSTVRADSSTYPSADEYRQLRAEAIQARGRLMAIAALMELNTGLPLDLSDAEIPTQPPESTLRALQDRVARLMPGVDAETIERIAIQYPLQVRSQQSYVLRPCDAPVLLVEPVTPYAGLLESQLRPYLARMRAVRLELGVADERVRAISARFGALEPHYLSMRDDKFAAALARELDLALEAAAAPRHASD